MSERRGAREVTLCLERFGAPSLDIGGVTACRNNQITGVTPRSNCSNGGSQERPVIANQASLIFSTYENQAQSRRAPSGTDGGRIGEPPGRLVGHRDGSLAERPEAEIEPAVIQADGQGETKDRAQDALDDGQASRSDGAPGGQPSRSRAGRPRSGPAARIARHPPTGAGRRLPLEPSHPAHSRSVLRIEARS